MAAVALGGWPAAAQTIRATVLSIGDGDTLRVREGSRTLNVRLACIHAPKTNKSTFVVKAVQQITGLGTGRKQCGSSCKTTYNQG